MSRDSKLDDEIDQSAKAEVQKVQSCPECGSTRIMRDYEQAEIVCMEWRCCRPAETRRSWTRMESFR